MEFGKTATVLVWKGNLSEERYFVIIARCHLGGGLLRLSYYGDLKTRNDQASAPWDTLTQRLGLEIAHKEVVERMKIFHDHAEKNKQQGAQAVKMSVLRGPSFPGKE
jgi:hypothetical protein